jgi:hypothetical protein
MFYSWQDEVGESRMRVAGFCEKVLAHQDKRAITYTSYGEQLAKLKISKDINAFLVSTLKLYFEKDFFFVNPLLFASKWCKITRGMKRSTQ